MSASPGPWRWIPDDYDGPWRGCLVDADGKGVPLEPFKPLIASAPDMLALLRELEWAITPEWSRCPVCNGREGRDGHEPDCRLGILLDRLGR